MPDNTKSGTTQGRAYTGERVTVYYDARRCLHFAECVRGLPEVFDVEKRVARTGRAPNESASGQ